MSGTGDAPRPPALAPFGLLLHHDGRFTHEGQTISNRRLREHFERSVEYLPEEQKYIVRLKQFRGQIEVQEAGFFVRSLDLATGQIVLSDGSREILDVSTLCASPIDGALLCRVKRECDAHGLLARFSHATQAEFGQAIEEENGSYAISIGGLRQNCPKF